MSRKKILPESETRWIDLKQILISGLKVLNKMVIVLPAKLHPFVSNYILNNEDFICRNRKITQDSKMYI